MNRLPLLPALNWKQWLVMPALSLLLAETILYFVYSIAMQEDMLFGWALGVLCHVAGIIFFHRAIGSDLSRFMLFAIGGIFTRLFVLIIFLFIVLLGGFLQAGPFVIGLLTAYFTGSWVEIALMTRLKSSRGQPIA